MSDDEEIEWAWLAGLIEGESCIGKYRYQHSDGHLFTTHMIAIEMNDRDVLERAHRITGVGSVNTKKARQGRQETYIWKVSNKRDVTMVLNRILPLMGVRRTNKIMEVLGHGG